MAGQLALLLSACRHQGIVCVDGKGEETIITAIADGTAVAGQVVGVPVATGIAAGSDVGAFEFFKGIQLPRYDTDVDSAPTAGLQIEIVIPKHGRRYNVAIEDPAGDLDDSYPLIFGNTAGNLEKGTNTLDVKAEAKASGGIANTSRFCECTWGGA